MLWLEFWGLSRGAKMLKKQVLELFWAVLRLFGPFSASAGHPPRRSPKIAAGSPKRSPQQPQKPRLRPKRRKMSPKRLQKELPKKPNTGIDLGGPCASFSWPFGVPFRLPDVVVLVLVVVSCGARCSACWSFALLSVAVVVVLVLLGCWFCVPAFGCS